MSWNNYWENFDLRFNRIMNSFAYAANPFTAFYMPALPMYSQSIFKPASKSSVSFYPELDLQKNTSNTPVTKQPQYQSRPQFKPEQLEFTKAKNMSEAINYARTKLGIKNFNLHGDLELANWVNEGLTEIYNKYKGKAPMPANVIKDRSQNIPGDAYYNKEHDILAISPDNKKMVLQKLLDKIDNTPADNKKTLSNWYKKAIKGDFSQVSFIDPKFQRQVAIHVQEFRRNPHSFDVTESRQLYHEINALLEPNKMLRQNPIVLIEEIYNNPKYKKYLNSTEFKSIAQISKLDKDAQHEEFYNIIDKLNKKGIKAYIEPQKSVTNNKFHVIYHEYGHFRHFRTTSFTALKQRNAEFKSNTFKQHIAEEVSSYAKTEPMEFVAEVYAGLMNGAKYSSEVMALYRSYNGPIVP